MLAKWAPQLMLLYFLVIVISNHHMPSMHVTYQPPAQVLRELRGRHLFGLCPKSYIGDQLGLGSRRRLPSSP